MSLVITWPTGIADEPAAQAGIAGLTADLLDEGAGKRGPLDVAEDVARIGAGAADERELGRHAPVGGGADEVARALLPIVADVVARPAFADKELDRVRGDRLTALLQLRDVPGRSRATRSPRRLWRQDPLRAPEIGSERRSRRSTARRCQVARRAAAARPGDHHRRRRRHARRHHAPARRRARRLDGDGQGQAQARVGDGAAAAAARGDGRSPGRGADGDAARAAGRAAQGQGLLRCLVTNAILGGQFISRLNFNLASSTAIPTARAPSSASVVKAARSSPARRSRRR